MATSVFDLPSPLLTKEGQDLERTHNRSFPTDKLEPPYRFLIVSQKTPAAATCRLAMIVKAPA